VGGRRTADATFSNCRGAFLWEGKGEATNDETGAKSGGGGEVSVGPRQNLHGAWGLLDGGRNLRWLDVPRL